MAPVTLTTPRLVLSIPTEADVDVVVDEVQDPEIPRWTTVPSPYARSDGEAFVARAAARWAEGTAFEFALRQDGRLVGMIGLYRHDAGVAEIGWWVAADARGQGLVAEAGRAVVDWAFGELGLERIEWRAAVGNVASARAARRLGFRYEGLLRRGLFHATGRTDGWIAGLLTSDDRMPVAWPVLDAAP